MNGSDTVRGLYVNYTNGSHTGASNNLYGVDIDNISASANATETAIRVGTGWDTGLSIESGGITISGGTFQMTGSARPSKKMVLSPEYPGAVLFGDGTNNTGTMTSDYTNSETRSILASKTIYSALVGISSLITSLIFFNNLSTFVLFISKILRQ